MSRFSENLSPELIGIHRRAQREKHWRFDLTVFSVPLTVGDKPPIGY